MGPTTTLRRPAAASHGAWLLARSYKGRLAVGEAPLVGLGAGRDEADGTVAFGLGAQVSVPPIPCPTHQVLLQTVETALHRSRFGQDQARRGGTDLGLEQGLRTREERFAETVAAVPRHGHLVNPNIGTARGERVDDPVEPRE